MGKMKLLPCLKRLLKGKEKINGCIQGDIMFKQVSKMNFFWLAVFFLWIKTFIVYLFGFSINLQNILQVLILLVNPLSAILFLLSICFLFKEEKQKLVIFWMSLAITGILYGNLLYFRFFSDFVTIPVLFQTSNMGDLNSSTIALMKPIDLLIFTDLLVLGVLYFKKFKNYSETYVVNKKKKLKIVGLAFVIFILNLGVAQIERPQLLTRSFDRELLVKNIGLYHYHVYDIILHSKATAQRVFADGSEINEVRTFTYKNYTDYDEELFGIAKDRNVFMILLESTQSFVIEETINGQEITPFLNKLIKESYYFEEFYHQTEQGKTSDSEFILNNSWFGRPSGAVFFTHAQNEYHSLPTILNEHGYHTSVFHANNKSFWNRDVIYENFGYDHFFEINDYELTEENTIGWGLKDIDFFKQSMPYLEDLPQPFYTKFITLTNHFPFELDEEDRMVPEFDSNSRTLNRYFPTVRYLDEAVKLFMQDIKEAGLYENSIFIFYGDHYGISQNHNEAMGQFLGKEITPFESVQLQRVPMIVHIPGHDGHKRMDTVSGQIDMFPTILHLLGIETKGQIRFGTDLFAPERDSFVVLRNGSFVTENVLFTRETCYSKADQTELEIEYCEPYIDDARKMLKYSDLMINRDLLRFEN